jgi:hypothetical protein
LGWICVGVAVNPVMVGAGTVADVSTSRALVTSVLPPGPVQVRSYSYVAAVLIAPVLKPVLEVGCVVAQPSEPVPPEPTQEVALVVVQVKAAELPG